MFLLVLWLATVLAAPAAATEAEISSAEAQGEASAAAPVGAAPLEPEVEPDPGTKAEPALALPQVGSARCVACQAPAPEPLLWFGEDVWRELEDGELWIDAETRGPEGESVGGAGRAAIVIERAPEDVWAVLIDFPSWPGFMPLVDASSIPRSDGNRRWVHMQYSVMFVDMEHTTIYTLERASGRLRWTIDPDFPHSIESSEGHWQLVPLGPDRTLVRYQSEVDSGRAVPEFVQRMLVQRSLRGLLTSLRDETVRRTARAR